MCCRCCRSSVMLRPVLFSSLLILSVWSSLVSGQSLTTVSQNLTVVEEQSHGHVIGQISVPSAVPPYTIYHADPQDTARILVSASGLVTVGERIDREEKSLYRLIAHASNNVNVEVMHTCAVFLNVKTAVIQNYALHRDIFSHYSAQNVA